MKCSPSIWKTFNPKEKVLWNTLRQRFESMLHSILVSNIEGDIIERLKIDSTICILSHNLACEAVWQLKQKPVSLKISEAK